MDWFKLNVNYIITGSFGGTETKTAFYVSSADSLEAAKISMEPIVTQLMAKLSGSFVSITS
jgi:hypothetical protein